MSLRGIVVRSHGPGEQLKAEEIELVAETGETLVEMRLAAVTQQREPESLSVLACSRPALRWWFGAMASG